MRTASAPATRTGPKPPAPSAIKLPPVKGAPPAVKSPPGTAAASDATSDGRVEPRILFQQFFKSVGPRTYAAQVKEAQNGNHFLVLTEGKRDGKTAEARKTRLFIFSEDFVEFFRLLQATSQFIKANPVPDEVRRKRERLWTKRQDQRPGRA
jgi:hypothetical protein